jgi:hypothetical protein
MCVRSRYRTRAGFSLRVRGRVSYFLKFPQLTSKCVRSRYQGRLSLRVRGRVSYFLNFLN